MNRDLTVMGMTVLVAAGLASAQNTFSKPMAPSKAEARPPSGSSRMLLKSVEGDDEYEVVVENGQVTAKVNGKKVPPDRIRRSEGKVEILDKKGNVQKSFNVGISGTPMPPEPPMAAEVVFAEPKVMIGIIMDDVSESLAEHLGIKQEDAVEITRVIEGLPADAAGLKAKDIVIEIDGVRPVTQKAFREAINKHDAGDKIEVKFLRAGKEQKVKVELQKFDGTKFGWSQDATTLPGFDMKQFDPSKDPQWREHMQEAMRNYRQQGGQGQAWVFGDGPSGNLRFFRPGEAQDSKRLEEVQAQIDKKLAELDEKLAKINAQMAQLEKLLNILGEKGAKE